jgi:hypothetical protein
VGKRRGGSHLEPSNERTPRLFHNAHAAKAFIGNWLQGTFNNAYYQDESGGGEPYTEVIKQPHRKKEDMEVVEFECFELSENLKSSDKDRIVAARYTELIKTEDPILRYEETNHADHTTYKLSSSDTRVIAKALLYFATSSPEFQERVWPWMTACFSMEICRDIQERCHRFIEEALELVQACGTTEHEVRQLVEYVYGRPTGDKVQEIGGVMVTLAALCLAEDQNMHEAGEIELKRIWEKIDVIRAKQAAKPKHSPLPA